MSSWRAFQHKANGNGAQTHDDDWFRQVFLPTVGKFVAAQVAPLKDEIAKLKAQVAEIQEGGVKYCGVYQRGNEYQRGQLVSADGSLWCAIANAKPLEIPGKAACWQLAVRAGRDAPRQPTTGVGR